VTRLKTLTVEGFRGIPTGALPFDGGSIVLGGGNGTGKTGFVDALEFLFTGSVSTLEGTSGLSVRQHAPHLLSDARSARVACSLVAPDAEVTRWLTGQLDAPGTVERFLREGKARTFILRRSQIQQFIHARPADRYRSMAELIGLEDLDRVEAALKRARDALLDRVLKALRRGGADLGDACNRHDLPPRSDGARRWRCPCHLAAHAGAAAMATQHNMCHAVRATTAPFTWCRRERLIGGGTLRSLPDVQTDWSGAGLSVPDVGRG